MLICTSILLILLTIFIIFLSRKFILKQNQLSKNHRIFFLIIIIMIATIGYPFVISTNSNPYYAIYRQNFAYSVKIHQVNGFEYTLIIPCILYNNMTINEAKIINGDCDLDLIKTDNGYGYKIKSKSNIEIKYSIDYLDIDAYSEIKEAKYKLSLRNSNSTINNQKGTYWMYYSSNSTNEIDILLKMNYFWRGPLGASGHEIILKSSLKEGWNMYDASFNGWIT